ncbi:MAG TPA: DUF6573 family protein [Gemmataceae bacterium]|nr:DUF6573 family protein [Gemmataceae bacterium]
MFESADLIHRYTRADALRDGVLIDVSATAREAGFKYPVALTAAAWVKCVVVMACAGLLVRGDDPAAAASEALRVLDDPAAHRPLGQGAAALVRERYDRDVTLPRLAAWLAQLAGGGK